MCKLNVRAILTTAGTLIAACLLTGDALVRRSKKPIRKQSGQKF